MSNIVNVPTEMYEISHELEKWATIFYQQFTDHCEKQRLIDETHPCRTEKDTAYKLETTDGIIITLDHPTSEDVEPDVDELKEKPMHINHSNVTVENQENMDKLGKLAKIVYEQTMDFCEMNYLVDDNHYHRTDEETALELRDEKQGMTITIDFPIDFPNEIEDKTSE